MVQIIRGMFSKEFGWEDEFSACDEITERPPHNSPHQPSFCSVHEPGFGVRRLADTPIGQIAVLRGDTALNPSLVRSARSP
jgi:hypothetical protein